MADKKINEFQTLTTASDSDLLLVSSTEETYNIAVSTLKAATNALAESAVAAAEAAVDDVEELSDAVDFVSSANNTNFEQLSNGTLYYPTITWEQGVINTSGDAANSKAIRTAGYISVAGFQQILIDIPSGHKFSLYYYTSTQAYYSRLYDVAQSSVYRVPASAAYFRVAYVTDPLTAITPEYEPKPIIRVLTGADGAYDIYPTGDTSNRVSEIRAKLSQRGVCRFAPGDYYIGTLNLYADNKLIGCGSATRIIKNIYDETNTYAIKCNAGCEIASLKLLGQSEDITPASIGATDGILIKGSGSSDSQRWRSNIHDVTVLNCTGAGIHFEQTGYNPQAGSHIENVFVRQCGIGIHLGQYAEYNRVNNVHCNACYIGILNNGGNNIISSSDFSTNVRGIVMDNTSDTMGNNSHGTFSACTVNHTNSNAGTAIEIINMHSGEVFTGMQVFYGGVVLNNASNVQFNGCNFGTSTPITISGGNVILFESCIFRSESDVVTTIANNTKTRFDNCFLRDGTEFDPICIEHHTDTIGPMLEIAETYFNVGYDANDQLIYLTQHGPYSTTTDENSVKAIVCSQFALACLSGLPYERSRYVQSENAFCWWGYHSDGTGHYSFDNDYMINMYWVQYLASKGLLVTYVDGHHNIKPGDLLFFGTDIEHQGGHCKIATQVNPNRILTIESTGGNTRLVDGADVGLVASGINLLSYTPVYYAHMPVAPTEYTTRRIVFDPSSQTGSVPSGSSSSSIKTYTFASAIERGFYSLIIDRSESGTAGVYAKVAYSGGTSESVLFGDNEEFGGTLRNTFYAQMPVTSLEIRAFGGGKTYDINRVALYRGWHE